MPNEEYDSPFDLAEEKDGTYDEQQKEDNESDVTAEETDGEESNSEQKKSISADLIRGHINTIILRALFEGDRYGYDIINEIEQKSHGQYQLKQPTLYSALKRLESQGYVKSYWGGVSNGGRRRYFSLTDEGREVVKQNQAEWEYSRTIIDNLISEKDFDFANPAPQKLDFRILRQSTSRTPIVTEDKSVDPQYVGELTILSVDAPQNVASEPESPSAPPPEKLPAPTQTSVLSEENGKSEQTQEVARENQPVQTQGVARENQPVQTQDKQDGQDEANFSLPLFSSLSERERNYKDIIASIYRKAIKPQPKPVYAAPAPAPAPQEIIREQAQSEPTPVTPAESTKEEVKEQVSEERYTEYAQTPDQAQRINEQVETKRVETKQVEVKEAASETAKVKPDVTIKAAPPYVPIETPLSPPIEQPPHERYKEEKKTASAKIDFYDVVEQARYDGLRVWTSEPTKEKKSLPEDFFNKGLTLLQSALVFFVIALLECLSVIFFKNELFMERENLLTPYVVVMLVCAVIVPFVCACLYFAKYQPCCKRSKNNTVIYNAIVLFIVLFILLIIVDLLIDFPLTDRTALLLYLVIPGVYLLNIFVFSVSYFLLSRSKNNA